MQRQAPHDGVCHIVLAVEPAIVTDFPELAGLDHFAAHANMGLHT